LSDHPFAYHGCPSCGLVFIDRPPDDLDRYYKEDYYQVPRSIEELAARARNEHYRIDIIQQFARSGRLLEIGASYGILCYLAKQRGFDVEAIERDEGCCRFLRDTLKIRAHQSSRPEETLRTLGAFDVIALWHVIEHLTDPWAFLQTAAAALKPGGILVLATPNPESFQFRILRERWPHVDAPRHLWLMPTSCLQSYVRPLKLDLLWSTTEDAGGVHWNEFGWTQYFVNMTGGRLPRRPLRAMGMLTTALTRFIERRPRQGCAYTAAFRKRSS